MTNIQTNNSVIKYFFLISLTLHTILLFYLGRSILKKRYNRRIEVALKSLSSTKPIRSIPAPYRRPKAVLKAQKIKTPVKSLIPKPVLTHAPAQWHSVKKLTHSVKGLLKIQLVS